MSYNQRLNAPYGARCFLTPHKGETTMGLDMYRLNAPYGARCFLTHKKEPEIDPFDES